MISRAGEESAAKVTGNGFETGHGVAYEKWRRWLATVMQSGTQGSALDTSLRDDGGGLNRDTKPSSGSKKIAQRCGRHETALAWRGRARKRTSRACSYACKTAAHIKMELRLGELILGRGPRVALWKASSTESRAVEEAWVGLARFSRVVGRERSRVGHARGRQIWRRGLESGWGVLAARLVAMERVARVWAEAQRLGEEVCLPQEPKACGKRATSRGERLRRVGNEDWYSSRTAACEKRARPRTMAASAETTEALEHFVISVSRGEKGRRGDRFQMGYDRARECRRSTEVNGRGFRNTDMDHYTTARFKGTKEEGKGDDRGLPGVKAAGGDMPKAGRSPVIRKLCRSPRWSPTSREVHGCISPDVWDKDFDKSGCRTEDGSQVCQQEYSDVGGSVKTTEDD
ncbi:hypothetical protein K438DRAFT_1949809 [Mycena galopus ATCC 62051]|nr:hypothetical protein K438DRAFT_1949809 [Mycena galopus ATCC 62051]